MKSNGSQARKYEPESIGGVRVLTPSPDIIPERPFVGREELVAKIMAAWLDCDGGQAMNVRLVGPPGVGKNEIFYHVARTLNQPLYMMLGHEEMLPEDIACTARITADNNVEYVASPLVAAMVHGGIFFFDEIGKLPTRSMSLLASVLDDRRFLASVLAGFTITAHPNFRFGAAMNHSDAAATGLPAYIDERLRPKFKVGYPPIGEVMEIVRHGLNGHTHVLLDHFRGWCAGHPDLSPRNALQIMTYATRLRQMRNGQELKREEADALIKEAAETVLDGVAS